MNANEFTKMLLENEEQQDILQMLTNLNLFQLNNKPHIKKYNKLRKIHGEILSSMQNYILSENYDIRKYDSIIVNELKKVVDNFDIDFVIDNEDDTNILIELFGYDNHQKIKSITDIYLEKKKFKNLEKVKLLECMKNSYVSLFKIVEVDRINGYVTYQDVFTKRKFKIIDIAMSSTLRIDKKREIYTYNRIITVDDISFATGIHCVFSSNCKSLMKFIKTKKYKKCSSFVRCLLLYDIYKKDGDIKSSWNHKYR